MTDLTRAQKTRLGLFLLGALGLFAFAAIVKIGPHLFTHHDAYHVRMPNGVSGLQPGAQVTYNGLLVGSVDSLQIDPKDVAIVDIELALAGDTVIPEDAKATVVMQGITGSRYVELAGGTNGARHRLPGEEIPAGLSLMDELADRGRDIAVRITGLLESVQSIATGPEGTRVKTIIAHTDRILESLDALLTESAPRISAMIARLDTVSDTLAPALVNAGNDLAGIMEDARATIRSVRTTADTLRDTVQRVSRDMVGPLLTRVSDAAQHVDQLVSHADGFLGRTQADVHRGVEAMVHGVDSFSDLADMLRSDPSSLVLGRTAKPRELP